MDKKILVPSLAALFITSTVQATVAVFMDPVQYKSNFNSSNPQQVRLAGWSPIMEQMQLGDQANNPVVHQSAENSLEAVHEHMDPLNRGPALDGSPFEACGNYQLEQLGIALNQSGSPLKKYLKGYAKTVGGKVQLGTMVQLNAWSPFSMSTQGLANPEFEIVEDGNQGVGLNFTPVLESYNTLQNRTPQMTCKILSAQEINQIAASQLAVLKAKHLQPLDQGNSFKYKDLVGEISAALQTVPKFGYPEHMDLQVQSFTGGQIKYDDVTPQNNPQTQPAVVAGTAN